MGYGRRKRGFWSSIGHLMGHLFGTAVIFITVMVLGWGVAYLAHALNSHHPFPPHIYNAVMQFEIGLFWFDVVISSIVLIFGGWRFVKDMLES